MAAKKKFSGVEGRCVVEGVGDPQRKLTFSFCDRCKTTFIFIFPCFKTSFNIFISHNTILNFLELI